MGDAIRETIDFIRKKGIRRDTRGTSNAALIAPNHTAFERNPLFAWAKHVIFVLSTICQNDV
jgi:hypothetical protein